MHWVCAVKQHNIQYVAFNFLAFFLFQTYGMALYNWYGLVYTRLHGIIYVTNSRTWLPLKLLSSFFFYHSSWNDCDLFLIGSQNLIDQSLLNIPLWKSNHNKPFTIGIKRALAVFEGKLNCKNVLSTVQFVYLLSVKKTWAARYLGADGSLKSSISPSTDWHSRQTADNL